MSDQKSHHTDKWQIFIALTASIFAVFAAIASLRSAGYSTKVQLATTQENNYWSYFQSKSTKQHLYEIEATRLELSLEENKSPKLKAKIEDKLKFYRQEIQRYDKEKAEIKKKAETISSEQSVYKRQSGNFVIAITLLQIAITLVSVSSLMKKKELWLVGLIGGVIGIVYMINGFYLIF